MQKKGVNNIIAVILIVLVGITAVSLIWSFVSTFIAEKQEESNAQITFQQTRLSIIESSLYINEGRDVSFLVERETGNGEIEGFLVVLTDAQGNTVTIEKYAQTPLQILERFSVEIFAAEHGLVNIAKIEVFGIIVSKINQEQITSSQPLSSLDISANGTLAGGGGGGGGNNNGGGNGGETYSTNLLPDPEPDQVFEPLAYANTHSVFNDTQEPITLYGENYEQIEIASLPSRGQLFDGATPVNSVPYSLSVNQITYVPSGTNGPDSFTFNVSNGSQSEKATIFIDVVPLLSNFPPRTEIADINASRWETMVALNDWQGINKTDYLDYIEERHDARDWYYRIHAGESTEPHQEDQAVRYAFFSYLAQDSAQKQDLYNMSIKLLRGSYDYYTIGPGINHATLRGNDLRPIAETTALLKRNPLLNETDEQFLHEFLDYMNNREIEITKYGTSNGAIDEALIAGLLANWYPEDDNTTVRQTYVNAFWEDAWGNETTVLRDTEENTDNYNSIYLADLHFGVQEGAFPITSSEFYADQETEQFFERYLAMASPLGIIPPYGDTTSPNGNPGRWTRNFEDAATYFNDGRFKYIARRLFEWTIEQEEEMSEWGNINNYLADNLAMGYLSINDLLAEEEPEIGSIVTYRKDYEYIGGNPHYQLLETEIPDKMIFRSGWERDDMYMIVGLARPRMGHGHEDVGAIHFMTAGGSILLTDTPYLGKDESLHNTFVLNTTPAPSDDTQTLTETTRVEVLNFEEENNFVHGSFKIINYGALDNSLTREIFFVKDRFVWVHDNFKTEEAIVGEIGPAWQTVSIYGQIGEEYVNTAQTEVPISYISPVGWVYQGNPGTPAYLLTWDNHPHDLLFKFPSQNGNMSIEDDSIFYYGDRTPRNTNRYRIWNKERVSLSPGDQMKFDSILLPHAPNPNTKAYADRFETVLEDENKTVIKYETQESITYLGINKESDLISIEGLQTDAMRFYIRIENNQIVDSWSIGGSAPSYG